ncbi:MAG TPA: DNA helicase RecQ [Terriglobia bacterium]|jgi:ATP-dependent DNA helicase RecQ
MSTDAILSTVKRYWGFSELRPLQDEAIRAGLEHQDSLVVMPTGGGKSLCYQVPPELAGRTDIVVSPLISLMKDQVDGLRECGYPAAALYSGMPYSAVRSIEEQIADGHYRLVFVAPERLLTARFLQLIENAGVRAFAIDEAHCISHWGHDFRPEYRQLSELKSRFPRASIHAYTATATERVRQDIVKQLQLRDPAVLVGTFDRPNLVYRIIQRTDDEVQLREILSRHSGEAAIVYCISRKDTERIAGSLVEKGVRAVFYHAGMDAGDRRQAQDKFASEDVDVVVATVAFGMGIDRSDVRVVVHAAMPKSIEHYQQETGRAGRDGLEAECVLLYSAADAMRWESLIEKAAANAEAPEDIIESSRTLLDHMRRLCSGVQCRHRQLSAYFGQSLPDRPCGACDVCLNEVEGLREGTVTAQKILSCVARTGERFGAEHIIDVLLGADTDRIRRWGHQQVKTYGLMQGTERKALTNIVYQLVDGGLLERTPGDRPVLKLNEAAWAVMRGQRPVQLLEPKTKVRKTRFDEESWEGVDRGLFETLRKLRRDIADDRGVPPFVLFSDATLRDLARLRPGSASALLHVRGIGEKKAADLGERFLGALGEYCKSHGLTLNNDVPAKDDRKRTAPSEPRKPNDAKAIAFEMFARGESLQEVAARTERASSTACGYLVEFIKARKVERVDAWVDGETYIKVAEAANGLGTVYLKPIYDRLQEKVPYDQIRIVVAHLESLAAAAPPA